MRLFSSPQAAIRAVLVSQVVLAAAIVGLDLMQSPGKAAPGLFTPAPGGPATRPYRPDMRPGTPGSPAMRPMADRLEFSAGDEVLRVSGQIAPGDATRFLAWLEETRPEPGLVTLDSSGGSVSDALAIGDTIRSAGYRTKVEAGAVCLSACPYILAAGVERSAAPGAVVGVHQSYFGKNTLLPAFMAVSDMQHAQANVMDYLTRMGIDLRLVMHALRTPPDEIRVLDAEEMRDLKLTTESSES
ncbi:ATP-dependent Clp protease proteolytic subunit [Paracoccus sp. MBLB3053]|uniref:ATP-dependent Clp protease proteolytic subunit n=1 Tax=Paracoccus aurantius TaxID=3073814 RepID=A0ABU2HUV1_9RHOB|nr:ATP-dependent Clp protease proteolytic subunit [Paracoccus sp. MBLB3053]MDS9468822.1 ATP-dependent Clp protease proteolytic subunit [Paracoccus sp. MBLB3053]